MLKPGDLVIVASESSIYRGSICSIESKGFLTFTVRVLVPKCFFEDLRVPTNLTYYEEHFALCTEQEYKTRLLEYELTR